MGLPWPISPFCSSFSFLVTTTINVDTGIGMVLPPPLDPEVEPPPIRERNLMKILVNAQGLVLMDEQPVPVDEVKTKPH